MRDAQNGMTGGKEDPWFSLTCKRVGKQKSAHHGRKVCSMVERVGLPARELRPCSPLRGVAVEPGMGFCRSASGGRISFARTNPALPYGPKQVCSMAERVGFEPTGDCSPAVFKTVALDHSAISPCSVG